MKKYYVIYGLALAVIFFAGSIRAGDYSNLPGMFTRLIFLGFLITAAVMDMAVMRIADEIPAGILATAAVSCLAMPEITMLSRVIGAVCVSGPFLIIGLLVPGAFGGGDVKLMAAGGAFLGWKVAAASAVTAIFLGGMWSIYLLIGKKKGRKEQFPLAPFLCLGMALGVSGFLL